MDNQKAKDRLVEFTFEFLQARFPDKISRSGRVYDMLFFKEWIDKFGNYSLEKIGHDSDDKTNEVIRRLIEKWRSDGLLILTHNLFGTYLNFGEY